MSSILLAELVLIYLHSSPRKRRSYVSLSMGIDDDMDEGQMMFTVFTGCVSGMIFGGIHCLGWNYLFQAHKEQILWRVASTWMARYSSLDQVYSTCNFVVLLQKYRNLPESRSTTRSNQILNRQQSHLQPTWTTLPHHMVHRHGQRKRAIYKNSHRHRLGRYHPSDFPRKTDSSHISRQT
jgi:hypothetical protein